MFNTSKLFEIRYRWFTLTFLLLMVVTLYLLAAFHPARSHNRHTNALKPLHSDPTKVQACGTSISDLDHLRQVMASHDYNCDLLSGNTNAVPRLYCQNFPQDLKNLKDLETKKELFLKVLLPMVLAVNEDILKDRAQLIKLRDKVDQGWMLNAEEREWLEDLATLYKVKTIDIAELLRRVDTIPPSMALAQAAVETGWGHSYAALKKNSLFGMMKTLDKVKFYHTLHESTASYIRNLNTNNAYQKMRETREQIRRQGKKPDGHSLIGDLVRYSVQRKLYISKIRSAIKKNNLAHLDLAKLERAKI
ncbi:MAG: glucosaminidase domain-containing protein [Alphaproteobacteria bacterium]|nr:glucosaminidase domain-containing protein [Alphaproteobacteria bacterium]